MIRVNETVFNFTLEVKYTGAGGGSLTLVNIMFREAETTTWNHHNQLSIELTLSRQTWYALVTNNHFAAISDVQFSFTTQNEMKQGIEMEARQIIGMYELLCYVCTYDHVMCARMIVCNYSGSRCSRKH